MQPKIPSNNKGAFLVIALILLIVLSALVVAAMNLSISAFRVSRNYSNYLQATDKAISMSGYGQRILDTYVPSQFPLPATCDSSGTCNVINNTFPYSGRPTFVWSANLDTENFVETAGSNSWWTTNGFAYEETFAGSGNARVIVSLVGAQTQVPWNHTYEIVGYATDMQTQARATSAPLFYSIRGYRPDPYPTSTGTNAYTNSSCTGGCEYGECCASGTCAVNAATCDVATESFVPAGWFCDDYFVTNLGFAATTCSNSFSTVLNAMNIVETTTRDGFDYFLENGSYPASVVVNGITVPHSSWTTVNYQGVSNYSYVRNSVGMMASALIPNANNKFLSYAVRDNGDGTASYVCGAYSITSFPNDPVAQTQLPPDCNCLEVNTWFTSGTGCTAN